MAIEIVDLPIENGGSFYSYVSLPEGSIRIGQNVDDRRWLKCKSGGKKPHVMMAYVIEWDQDEIYP